MKDMKIVITMFLLVFVILILLFICVMPARVKSNAQEKWSQANLAYEQGKFEESVAFYNDLLAQECGNADLYYNLGDAYYRTGKSGKALLNYRRAERLSPRDENIRFNLKYLRARINSSETEENILLRFGRSFFYFFSLNELSAAVLILFLIFSIVMALYLFRKISSIGLKVISIVFGIVLIWAGVRIYLDDSVKEAVVVVSKAEARNGPGTEYQVIFTAPDGEEVVVLSREKGWMEIGLPSRGLKGWVTGESVELLKGP